MTCMLYRKEHVRRGIIHPSGKLLALLVASNANTVELYRIDGADRPIRLLWSYQTKHVPNCLDWCDGNRSVCIGDSNGNITVIDTSGTVKNQNCIHTKYNEVVAVRSMNVNMERTSRDGEEGVCPKYLIELTSIYPYVTSLRDFVSNDFTFSGTVQNFVTAVCDTEESDGCDMGDFTDAAGSLETEFVGSGSEAPGSLSAASQSDCLNQEAGEAVKTKEAPRLIPDFSGQEKEISLFVSLDANNNMICSIGGHTPVWNYRINRSGEDGTDGVGDVSVCKNYIVVTYNHLDGNLNCRFEVIDVRYFLEAFDSIFSVFGRVQYIRQLMAYLRGVIKQIHSVWKTGVVPFRQFISSESSIKSDKLLAIMYSMVFGLPLNTYITKEMLSNDLNVTIDQLAVVCQSIDDSVRYMLYVLSNTVHPILEHTCTIWDVVQNSEIAAEMGGCGRLGKQVDGLLLYYKGVMRELESVCPIVNVFIHTVSIAKTYAESSSDFDGFDRIGFPRIISSGNSRIISDKFHIGEKDYQLLKEFLAEKGADLGAGQGLCDNSSTSAFFECIEFKNIDELLADDNSPEFSVSRMSSTLDEFYRLLVRHVTERYISNKVLLDFSVDLSSNVFSSADTKGNLNVSVADGSDVMLVTLLGKLKNAADGGADNQSALIKIMVEFGNDEVLGLFELDGKRESCSQVLGDLDNSITIHHSNSIHSPIKANFSVSAAIVSLPNAHPTHKVVDAIWTADSEILMLINNGGSSSRVLGFSLDLLNFCSVPPLSIDIGHCSTNKVYYNYVYGISKFRCDSNCHHSISNVFHHLKDVSRIHRPQRAKGLLPDCAGNGRCSVEIVSFYSKNNTKFFVISDRKTGRIAIGNLE
ncbi:hypothetical protein FG386_001726 [Cryptosporidium ryanae]|uniref:uncharacterized protein n=1 Tax=Cryptosporidium ryanae TaxID=515981 RepID=UPI00351A241A|nr:hypothetical protein FG386_001726 [Cryptosporidium ryanae]